MIGKTIDGKYQVVRLLGQGGMGAVYEATHLGTGRRVAVKVITGDIVLTQDVVARFQREARAAGSIESQHIVQVLDSGVDRDQGLPFMVMEFLNGEDLEKLVERLGALPPELALRITAQACVGLQKAHEASVVHRDIKPANLYLSRRDGGELVVRLLDFGIAKVKMDQLTGADRGLTRTGSMLGSPLYMSPEQAMGLKTIDHRTDIWSLGAVLNEALTGRTPHHDKDTFGQLIIAICSTPPQPIQQLAPWIPPHVAELVHRALRLDPNERFASAAAMLDALRELLPSGFGLHESQLIALPEADKQRPADIFRVPTDAGGRRMTDSGNVLPPIHLANTAASPGITANPLTATNGAASTGGARSKAPLIGGVLIALAAAGVGAAWFESHGKAPAEVAALPAPSAAPVAATPAVSVPAAVQPIAAVAPPTARTVQVRISPATAKVELDGHEATVQGGELEISGTLGSAHVVHVTLGPRQNSVQVVIAESGALPDHVELVAASAPAGAAASKSQAHAPAAAAAATPAVAAKTAKPSGPALDKKFE